MSELAGKVALVTGASRGIGRAIAVALARAGADIAINYRTREDAAPETAGQVSALGRRSLVVVADVSLAAEVTRLAAEVEAGLGPVDIRVNTAGIARPLLLEQVTERLGHLRDAGLHVLGRWMVDLLTGRK
jgi:3-oxoacyl-[acyl-carrier protein] reductase